VSSQPPDGQGLADIGEAALEGPVSPDPASWARRLTFRSGLLVFFRVVDIGVNAVTTVLVARLLGPLEFGALGFATAAAVLVYTLTDFGLTRAFVHQIASGDNVPSSLTTYFAVRIPLLIVSGLATLVLATLAPAFLGLGTAGIDLLAIMFVVGSLRALASFGQVTLEAQQRVLASQTVVFAYSLSFALLVPAAAWRLPNATSVALASLVPSVLGLAVALWHLQRIGFGRPQRALSRRYFGFALPLVGASVAGSIGEYIDKFLLQVSFGSLAMGYYTAAQRLVGPLAAPWGAVGNFLLASVVRGRRAGDPKDVVTSVRGVEKLASLLLAILVAPLVVDSDGFVTLVFGEPYRPAALAVSLLSFRMWTDTTNLSGMALALGAGRARAYGNISMAMSGLFVLLALLIVPPPSFFFLSRGWGLDGAAACSAIVGLFALLTTEFLVTRTYQVAPRSWPFACLAVAIFGAFCARQWTGAAPDVLRIAIEVGVGCLLLGLLYVVTDHFKRRGPDGASS